MTQTARIIEVIQDIGTKLKSYVPRLVATGDDVGQVYTRVGTTHGWADAPAGGGGGSSDPLVLEDEYGATTPAAPIVGVKMFTRARGRRRPSWVGASGHDSSVQSLLGANKIRLWTAQGNANTVTAINIISQVVGAVTVRNVTSDSHFNSVPRLGYVQATAAANQTAGIRHNALQFFRGNPDGTGAPGGFEIIHRFGIVAIGAAGKGFMGMVNTASALSATLTPSTTMFNCAGVGFDAADNTFSAYCNSGSGGAEKVNFGSEFSAVSQGVDFYESRVFIPPWGDKCVVSLENLRTKMVAEATFTTKLPVIGAMLAEQIWLSSGADAIAPAIDISSRFIETDF